MKIIIIIIIIIFKPLLVLSQQNSILDYTSSYIQNLNIINDIDSQILVKQKELKEYISLSSTDTDIQSNFETNQKYLERMYWEEYGMSFWFIIDEINNLKSKRIYYKSFEFITRNINLNLLDSNYDANKSKWLINGTYETTDIDKTESNLSFIDWFKLDISPEHAEILFLNKKELIIDAVFSAKYEDLSLMEIKIYIPNSSDYIIHKFPETYSKTIVNPISEYEEDVLVRNYIDGKDYVHTISYESGIPNLFKFSNNDNFLAFSGNSFLCLYDLKKNLVDTIFLKSWVEVSLISRDRQHSQYLRNKSYFSSNINKWDIDLDFRKINKDSTDLVLQDFAFSPNDSMVVFILKANIERYYPDPGPDDRDRAYIIVYNIYEENFIYYEPVFNAELKNTSIKNIFFPYMDNNYFYVTLNGTSSSDIKVNNTIEKICLENNKIVLAKGDRYFIEEIYNIENISISYDNKFFLIEGNLDLIRDGSAGYKNLNSYIYNIEKEKLLLDYTLPASYYNMFPKWNNQSNFSMPFQNDKTKILDISCPECSNHQYLSLSNKNIFKCGTNNGCGGSYGIINDKFYSLYRNDFSFSLNHGMVAIRENLDSPNLSLIFSTDQACISEGSYLDKCGECVSGNTGKIPCKKDCNGEYGGEAYYDDCQVCSGGNTNIKPNSDLDSCGVCYGKNLSCIDCNNVINGTAYLDNCGKCVGGNTANFACEKDCHGYYGGEAYYDDCNRCVGGMTALSACRKKFYENGNLRTEYYEDKNNEMLFERNRYENGFLKNELSFTIENKYEKYYDNEGNLDGIITYWYDNMQIRSQMKYVEGELKRGTHQEFFYNGKISKKIVIFNTSGTVTLYNIQGKKIDKYKCDLRGFRLN